MARFAKLRRVNPVVPTVIGGAMKVSPGAPFHVNVDAIACVFRGDLKRDDGNDHAALAMIGDEGLMPVYETVDEILALAARRERLDS